MENTEPVKHDEIIILIGPVNGAIKDSVIEILLRHFRHYDYVKLKNIPDDFGAVENVLGQYKTDTEKEGFIVNSYDGYKCIPGAFNVLCIAPGSTSKEDHDFIEKYGKEYCAEKYNLVIDFDVDITVKEQIGDEVDEKERPILHDVVRRITADDIAVRITQQWGQWSLEW